MTAEQLEAARAERMRQNGHGAISIEDVRTWIEETGLCIFLPRPAQAGQSVLTSPTATPTFVEAVAGQRTPEPTPELIAAAESLLVRLEAEGIAVRLNLGGQPLNHSGDQPDYVVAGWVLPYIYALRGDRDWRRSPQLTGSRQVSQLAVLTAKQLDSANLTAAQIRDALGREVTEAAVLRALHELWKQLRVIPVVPEVGSPALWQPLRQRFQKAIAEGASTSQVTAISVLASIYLQAVIAASMEDVEMFLSPLTSRSKIREVVRGLAATRQVHTTSMGHSPMFYVAGTLPEFPATPSYQISNTLPSYRSPGYMTSYLGHAQDRDLDHDHDPGHAQADSRQDSVREVFASEAAPAAGIARHAAETPTRNGSASRPAAASAHTPKPQASAKPTAPRPRPARSAAAAHPRERSRSAGSGDNRRAPAPRSVSGSGNRTTASSSRPARNGSFGNAAAKPAHSANGHAHNGNGSKAGTGSWKAQPAGNGAKSHSPARPASGNGHKSAHGASSGYHAGPKPGVKSGAKHSPSAASRSASSKGARVESHNAPRNGATSHSGARPASGQRRPADTASRKPAASAAKRYSFSGQAKQAPKPASKHVSGRASGPASKTGVASKSHGKPARPVAAKRRG